MKKVRVGLRPIVSNINLPTVMKSMMLPGDSMESFFIATQVGEIFYIRNGEVRTFLNIRPQVIELGAARGGYDERGLLGLAFHPEFYFNGLFYIHYSVAGTEGPGALSESFQPDPCNPKTLNLRWTNRETQYDHIDTIEEWILQSNGQPRKRRTLLNVRRPFFNHNGVNSLHFSPETGKLVYTNGDGGSGYDPFNLSQDNMEIAGKIIEMDVNYSFVKHPPVVTRFDELPPTIQAALTVMAKGIRNIPGISFQKVYNQYVKYVGNVGQDLVESIFSFVDYKPIPVPQLIQAALMKTEPHPKGFINLGWRGWEGAFPTSFIEECGKNSSMDKKTITYYNEAIKTSFHRIHPLTSYFHNEPRPEKFGGTALTGVQTYMGNRIPELAGNVVFTDLARNDQSKSPSQGVLAYTKVSSEQKLQDFSEINVDYHFGFQSSYYVSLGTNSDQTRLFLGVCGSMKVTDFNKGSVFEIVP